MQMQLIIPKNYNPVLDLRDTEIAIKLVKDFFEQELAKALNLTRVSAPIMVLPESGQTTCRRIWHKVGCNPTPRDSRTLQEAQPGSL